MLMGPLQNVNAALTDNARRMAAFEERLRTAEENVRDLQDGLHDLQRSK